MPIAYNIDKTPVATKNLASEEKSLLTVAMQVWLFTVRVTFSVI